MNLRRQLLLVSLLTLILPWAGSQFIRETESALRDGQQQMLSGTAQAIADSLSQFPYEMLSEDSPADQVYAHPLQVAPLVDGYATDWSLPNGAMRTLRGKDGPIRFTMGQNGGHWYLFADVRDDSIVFRDFSEPDTSFDHVLLSTVYEDGSTADIRFAAEAPGPIVATRVERAAESNEPLIEAFFRDTPTGYSVEARIPRNIVGPRIGFATFNVDAALPSGITSTSYEADLPGSIVTVSPVLQSVARGYAQPGWRLIIVDRHGWRIANVGSVSASPGGSTAAQQSGWLRLVYSLVLESGAEALLAEPAPGGRETQAYVRESLDGQPATRWFRSADTGRAVVSVAQPVWSGNIQTGAVILQQSTDAILSLTNQALTRLIVLTLTATIIVAVVLLGYASWLSFRIRRLSEAAELALEEKRLRTALPSVLDSDEVGDLSRSFSSVLRQLGIYNEYLQSLAGKLSHELRTPLAIVRSSLENLEHEDLPADALEYTTRAKAGTDRLRKILSAMSEASRTEELIDNAETEDFDVASIIESAVRGYADAWPDRDFTFNGADAECIVHGAPELIVQMLDKLIDNAIDFTSVGDGIDVSVSAGPDTVTISVANPGPPLPEKMRDELFRSMVSVRGSKSDKHLGLGLYVARLIAEGHNGSISADNIEGGVRFSITLPTSNSG